MSFFQYFKFEKIEVRNLGSLVVSNEKVVRTFVGEILKVLGGGKISSTHLEVQVKEMTIDSLGIVEASMHQHPNLGKGMKKHLFVLLHFGNCFSKYFLPSI